MIIVYFTSIFFYQDLKTPLRMNTVFCGVSAHIPSVPGGQEQM